jgi:hypothetical protein
MSTEQIKAQELLSDFEEKLAVVSAERERLGKEEDALKSAIEGIRNWLGLNASGLAARSNIDEPSQAEPVIPKKAFKDMDTRPAARKYLELVGKPQSTREILNALLDGGWTTKSEDPIDVLNGALKRDQKKPNPMFIKKDGKWELGE